MTKQMGGATVVFSGDLTIRTAETVRGELLAALVRGGRLAVDCSTASDVDLTFIQQIIAARRSAARAGGALSIDPPAAGVLLAAVERGGYLAEDGRFWTGGGC